MAYIQAAKEQGGELDVLDGGQLVDQVERLEDEPDAPPAQDRPLGLREPLRPRAGQPYLTGVGSFEPAEQM